MLHRGPKSWYSPSPRKQALGRRHAAKRMQCARARNIPPDSVTHLEERYNAKVRQREKFKDPEKTRLMLQLLRNPEQSFATVAAELTKRYNRPYSATNISQHLRFLRGLHLGYKYPWAHSNNHWRYRKKGGQES